jgi:hypothetical protein
VNDEDFLNLAANYGKNLSFQYSEGRNTIINLSAGDLVYKAWQHAGLTTSWD